MDCCDASAEPRRGFYNWMDTYRAESLVLKLIVKAMIAETHYAR